MTRAQYGDQRACALCGMDIEWHGRRKRLPIILGIDDVMIGGWRDRGGNAFCDTSGAARYNEDGHLVPFPHVLHKPTKDDQ